MTYACPIPFANRFDAAAVYCSDGRYGEHFDDFLINGLSLNQVDRVALPGGPACLLDPEQTAPFENLLFLIEAHELQRVVLIQHHGCAFYTHCRGMELDDLPPAQNKDMAQAKQAILERAPHVTVEMFYAHLDNDRVRFEVVDIQ